MKLQIKKYPDPILRKRADKIEKISPAIIQLGKDMIAAMERSVPEGVGLAGPQVGVPKRIIVVQTEKGPMIFINPEILKENKEKEIMEEGCLSFPGFSLKIKRPKKIDLEYVGINGEKEKIKAEGILARIFQHEIDHLDGVLIIDRTGFRQKVKSFFKK